ncbi:hypothetical protein L209DRAFT_760446 [Thermothelomyces heterothallicus CBS 203.75]
MNGSESLSQRKLPAPGIRGFAEHEYCQTLRESREAHLLDSGWSSVVIAFPGPAGSSSN